MGSPRREGLRRQNHGGPRWPPQNTPQAQLRVAGQVSGAALDVTLTDDEIGALEEGYTPRQPTGY